MGNIILIGMPASGKTTIGRLLAQKLNMDFYDTDALIEREQLITVSEIFEKYGEKHFRQLEHLVCQNLFKLDNAVIATGGGVFTNPQNLSCIDRPRGIIYLKASVGTILERTKNDKSRPLLQNSDKTCILNEIILKREPMYTNLANITVCTDDKTIDQTLEEVFMTIMLKI